MIMKIIYVGALSTQMSQRHATSVEIIELRFSPMKRLIESDFRLTELNPVNSDGTLLSR